MKESEFTSEIDERRKVIFEQAAYGTEADLKVLRDRLLVEWSQHPDNFLYDLYGLYTYNAQGELFACLSEPGIPKTIPGEKLELVRFIKNIIKEGEDWLRGGSQKVAKKVA